MRKSQETQVLNDDLSELSNLKLPSFALQSGVRPRGDAEGRGSLRRLGSSSDRGSGAAPPCFPIGSFPSLASFFSGHRLIFLHPSYDLSLLQRRGQFQVKETQHVGTDSCLFNLLCTVGQHQAGHSFDSFVCLMVAIQGIGGTGGVAPPRVDPLSGRDFTIWGQRTVTDGRVAWEDHRQNGQRCSVGMPICSTPAPSWQPFQRITVPRRFEH